MVEEEGWRQVLSVARHRTTSEIDKWAKHPVLIRSLAAKRMILVLLMTRNHRRQAVISNKSLNAIIDHFSGNGAHVRMLDDQNVDVSVLSNKLLGSVADNVRTLCSG
jgi:hypothetical protein